MENLKIEDVTNINELRQIVENNFSSVFTKEDVFKLLNKFIIKDELLEPKASNFNVFEFNDMVDEIVDMIEDYEPDLDDYDLSLIGNEIQVDSCKADMTQLKKYVSDTLESFKDNLLNK